MSKADPEMTVLNNVCTALAKLATDEARQRVVNFAIAKFNLTGGSKTTHDPGNSRPNHSDPDELYTRFDHTKPAENVALIVARHYSMFGTHPFTVTSIKTEAANAGLTVPTRIDMTLVKAARKGKHFYQKVGKEAFRVTVHGEALLKTTYGVKKGTGTPT